MICESMLDFDSQLGAKLTPEVIQNCSQELSATLEVVSLIFNYVLAAFGVRSNLIWKLLVDGELKLKLFAFFFLHWLCMICLLHVWNDFGSIFTPIKFQNDVGNFYKKCLHFQALLFRFWSPLEGHVPLLVVLLGYTRLRPHCTVLNLKLHKKSGEPCPGWLINWLAG